MPYYNYFPAYQQPNYYGQNPYAYQQAQAQQQPQAAAQQAQPQQPTIQHSGFVLVPSEQDARAYPVAPGNSVTFKDENAPYCYVKTMGFNQLDRPSFEKYRLVKEECRTDTPELPTSGEKEKPINPEYALKGDLAAIWNAVEDIRGTVAAMQAKKAEKAKKSDQEAGE